MASKYVFWSKIKFYWTDATAHIAPVLGSGSALPTTYPIAGTDLNTWKKFSCIEAAGAFGKLTAETSEHRCIGGDDGGLVEELSNGFSKAEPFTMDVTWDQDEFDIFKTKEENLDIVRILMVLPLVNNQTTPFRYAIRFQVKSCSLATANPQELTKFQLEFSQIYDRGVFVKGASS